MSNMIDYTETETQEMVQNLLHIGPTTVIFMKKDGTERTMKCTLKESLIPSDKAPKGDSNRKTNNTVQPVFDLDIGDWRSFTWSSITEVSV
jgi:hypothetical protein